jgi:hypothetical protein
MAEIPEKYELNAHMNWRGWDLELRASQKVGKAEEKGLFLVYIFMAELLGTIKALYSTVTVDGFVISSSLCHVPSKQLHRCDSLLINCHCSIFDTETKHGGRSPNLSQRVLCFLFRK